MPALLRSASLARPHFPFPPRYKDAKETTIQQNAYSTNPGIRLFIDPEITAGNEGYARYWARGNASKSRFPTD
ncbi:hypothetical protein O988_04891 [Pseudogymnoascus sp. VKM F-3808]|nr:hypothetical protein O988_04891 [Pseudogymnoascus sp. VKM F-3808]